MAVGSDCNLMLGRLQVLLPECPLLISLSVLLDSCDPMSDESVMLSNYLILCHPPLLLPLISPSIRVFSNESGRF